MIGLKSAKPLTNYEFLLTQQELHLKQTGFTDSVCGPFTRHHKRIQKSRDTGNLKHLYRNELVNACFTYDAAYPDSKDFAKRTISYEILKNRAYEIVRNCEYHAN